MQKSIQHVYGPTHNRVHTLDLLIMYGSKPVLPKPVLALHILYVSLI